eukprot:5400667-Pleurochrysis_carterae.AAC.6
MNGGTTQTWFLTHTSHFSRARSLTRTPACKTHMPTHAQTATVIIKGYRVIILRSTLRAPIKAVRRPVARTHALEQRQTHTHAPRNTTLTPERSSRSRAAQVPLLDMRRYHKLLAGASWMEEYGDPDAPGVWQDYLKDISPYHRLRLAVHTSGDGDDNVADATSASVSTPRRSGMVSTAAAEEPAASSIADGDGRAAAADTGGGTAGDAAVAGRPAWAGAPKTLFTTSTRDDRVHPGHARKMVAAMLSEVRRQRRLFCRE